jgi:hypothetical protein
VRSRAGTIREGGRIVSRPPVGRLPVKHSRPTQRGPGRITRVEVDVCAAHLDTRSTSEVAGNDAQCIELAARLAPRASARTVIFGGDVNGRASCAPDGLWTRTDRSAEQAPGLQHVDGSGALGSPSAKVVPAMHTDHDVLLVRAYLTAPG